MLSIVIIAGEDMLVQQTAFEGALQVCRYCISSVLEIPITGITGKKPRNCNMDSSSLWVRLLLDLNKSISTKEIASAISMN